MNASSIDEKNTLMLESICPSVRLSVRMNAHSETMGARLLKLGVPS